jgi:hypothetical protein
MCTCAPNGFAFGTRQARSSSCSHASKSKWMGTFCRFLARANDRISASRCRRATYSIFNSTFLWSAQTRWGLNRRSRASESEAARANVHRCERAGETQNRVIPVSVWLHVPYFKSCFESGSLFASRSGSIVASVEVRRGASVEVRGARIGAGDRSPPRPRVHLTRLGVAYARDRWRVSSGLQS